MAAYLKKKGENLATHEDIAKLVDQVRAVTTATKEIEAKISTDVWDRQKRWEMKRVVLFEETKRLEAVTNALIGLNTTFRLYKQREQNGEPVSAEHKLQAGNRWMEAAHKLAEMGLLLNIVCRVEVSNACDDIYLFVGKIAGGILNDDLEIYNRSVVELAKKKFAVMDAIRKELETDKTV